MNPTVTPNHTQRPPSASGQKSAQIPRKIMVRAILTVVISAILTGGLFAFFYIQVFHAPTPYHLPIDVVGMDADALQTKVGGQYQITKAADLQDAKNRLARHDTYAILTLNHDGQDAAVQLYYNSIDQTVLAYVRPIAQGIAQAIPARLDAINMSSEVPTNAAPGRSIFFAVFGTALVGFVLSQGLNAIGKIFRLSLLNKLGIMTGTSLIAGGMVAFMLDFGFHIAPATFWAAWPMVSLLCLAAVTTGSVLLNTFGPIGQVITAVLFITLGNATASGILPLAFLTPTYQAFSHILPTGNVVRAIMGMAYFHGADQMMGYIVPLLWSIIAVLMMAVIRDRA